MFHSEHILYSGYLIKLSVKVCKFGGTSLADGNIIKAVKKIIESDEERRYIVVSAPGKRCSGDTKITDLLYSCHHVLLKDGACKNGFAPVRARFYSIVKELNIDFDIQSMLDETERLIDERKSEDFTASRGEYLCAQIMARLLGAKFIDAENVIFFKPDGSLDCEKSYMAVSEACVDADRAVFPGFYGQGAGGKVKTFSRGGSDISGAIVARALRATLYENWTDVSGFLACDPCIVDSPRHIQTISYKEMRELSYMGANVLHSDSILPVSTANIPIQIKNTFRPQDIGTAILPNSRHVSNDCTVRGIAGKKNFTIIYIEKSLMNAEVGFIAKVLDVLQNKNVRVEHISSGIDTLSLVISSEQFGGSKLRKILDGIKAAVTPDSICAVEGIALIATVGHGMTSSVGTAARIFNTIAAEGIILRMFDIGSGELSVIVGVNIDDYERCIKSIYSEFFK